MEVLVLAVGRSFHAVALDRVREVVAAAPVSPVPGAPPWLLGVANLRGSVLPVIDTARALGEAVGTAPTHFAVVDTADGPAAVVAEGPPEMARLGEVAGAGRALAAVGTYDVDGKVVTLVDLDVLCGTGRMVS
jgi:chemotaxis signal transduction protein